MPNFRPLAAVFWGIVLSAALYPYGWGEQSPSEKPSPSAEVRDSLERFHSIIPEGEKPRLLIDGAHEKPGLTMTEGPAWIHGKLYFSNYYMFWKKSGTSEEGGLCVYEPNSAWRVLNRDVQTCGTDSRGKVFRVAECFENSFPNGLALSPDRKALYLNDSLSTALWKFDVQSDGALTNRWHFADLTLAENKRNAEKKTTTTSHCVFGGKDLTTLYVTGGKLLYSVQTKQRGMEYPLR